MYFERVIGIDYSGAATTLTPLPGLRVFVTTHRGPTREVRPRPGRRTHWTRRGIAEWLLQELSTPTPTLVGIDHGFSFPLDYFRRHALVHGWPEFLQDFRAHWPTHLDDVSVQVVREGRMGAGLRRAGDARWKRLTERRAGGAKSVFLFDVQGSVAKSTHAGLPWLLFLREKLGPALHFWPFDGWTPPPGRSVIAEVYPSLWSRSFPRRGRSQDQHDAWSVATWLRDAMSEDRLKPLFAPPLGPEERSIAAIEGWILGVMDSR